MISLVLDQPFHELQNDILDSNKRFILFVGFYLEKMWKILEKRPFFRADMAGLGKYHTGGYGRIGVYRVKGWGGRWGWVVVMILYPLYS